MRLHMTASASFRFLVVWAAAAACLFSVSYHCFLVRHVSKLETEWALQSPPYPRSFDYHLLQATEVPEPSYYANGTLQGVAAVRTLHVSVTRNDPTSAIASDGGGALCAPDAMTVADKQLKTLVASHNAAVVLESVDAIDGCTTLHVQRRVQLPYAAAEGFVAQVLSSVRGDVVMDASSVQELPNVNAGANFGAINVSLDTERNRLARYQALYSTPGLNLTDKAPLLERVMAHERSVLALEHQLRTLQAKMESLTTTVEIRLLDRDGREWEARKALELRGLRRDVVKSSWMTGVTVALTVFLFCWARRAKPEGHSECVKDVDVQPPIAVE